MPLWQVYYSIQNNIFYRLRRLNFYFFFLFNAHHIHRLLHEVAHHAFYIATHEAVQRNGRIEIVPASISKCNEAEFIMLRDGRVAFEGNAAELRASRDEYLKTFLS